MTEATMNQYAPPTATVADVVAPGAQALNLYSADGRIGRLRFLAYGMGVWLINLGVSAFLGGVLGLVGGVWMGQILSYLLLIPMVWFCFITSIKRCHDLNLSGWWTLTALVPFLWPVLWLIWALVPGSQEANRFGAPPPPNNVGVRILGLLAPVTTLVIIGVLVAVAVPAYNGYMQKAKARAEQMQQVPQQASQQ